MQMQEEKKVATVRDTVARHPSSLPPSAATSPFWVVTHVSQDCRRLAANIAKTQTDNDDITKRKIT